MVQIPLSEIQSSWMLAATDGPADSMHWYWKLGPGLVPGARCEDPESGEDSNNFKTVSKMVKEVLGNKGYRILLVEDDETNRNVSLHSSCPCFSGTLTNA